MVAQELLLSLFALVRSVILMRGITVIPLLQSGGGVTDRMRERGIRLPTIWVSSIEYWKNTWKSWRLCSQARVVGFEHLNDNVIEDCCEQLMNKLSPIEVLALQDETETLLSMRVQREEGPRWKSGVREGSEVCCFSEKRIDPFYWPKPKKRNLNGEEDKKARNSQQFPGLTSKGYLVGTDRFESKAYSLQRDKAVNRMPTLPTKALFDKDLSLRSPFPRHVTASVTHNTIAPLIDRNHTNDGARLAHARTDYSQIKRPTPVKARPSPSVFEFQLPQSDIPHSLRTLMPHSVRLNHDLSDSVENPTIAKMDDCRQRTGSNVSC